MVFRTDPGNETITLGAKAGCRLQAHAYSAAVVLTVLGRPDYSSTTPEERNELYAPANALLTWAVSRDLQQQLQSIKGKEIDLDDIMVGARAELPSDLFQQLTDKERTLGEGLFQLATGFIVLHELAHLELNHVPCAGSRSVEQEFEADKYAAEWLLDSSGMTSADRINRLLACAIVMIWLTVFDVFLGPSESKTHPESYERLYRLLDKSIDEESDNEPLLIWGFTALSLFVYMDMANVEVAALPTSEKHQVRCLIGLISKQKSK